MGGDADGVTLGDTIEDESALDADESSLMAGLKDDMAKLLERLPAREAAVMKMRYGLDGEMYTLDDIGRILKVSHWRYSLLRYGRYIVGVLAVCCGDEGWDGGEGAGRMLLPVVWAANGASAGCRSVCRFAGSNSN